MQKVNNRNKWSLSVGCVGRDLCYTLVSLFLLTYLQFTGLFNTSQFLVLSVRVVSDILSQHTGIDPNAVFSKF